MRARTLLVWGLAVALGVLVYSVAGRTGGGTTGAPGGHESEPAPAPSPSSLPVQDARVAVPSREIVLHVVDAQTSHALGGAQARRAPLAVTRSHVPGPAVATAGADGVLTIPQEHHGATLLVTAADHATASISAVSQTVALQRAHRFTLLCYLEGGEPLAGCVASLSPIPPPAPEPSAGRAMGDPRSQVPVWTSTTDGTGLASFEGLPAGKLYLRVFHPTHCCEDKPFTIDVPADATLTLTFRPVFAFVARPTVDTPVMSWHAHVSMDELRQAPGALTQLVAVAKHLRHRFPGALVKTGLPKDPAKDVVARITASLQDGSAWEAHGPMVPVAAITGPVPMHVTRDPGLTPVRLVLLAKGPDGKERPVDGMEVRFAVRRESFPARTGAIAHVPPGVYKILTKYSVPVLSDFLEDNTTVTVVAANGVQDLVIRVPMAVCRVALEISLPHGEVDTPVYVGMDGGNGHSATTVWTPERGALELWLPAGGARFDVSADHYEAQRRDVELRGDTSPTKIAITLPYAK